MSRRKGTPLYRRVSVGKNLARHLKLPDADSYVFREGDVVDMPPIPTIRMPDEWIRYFHGAARYGAWVRWQNMDPETRYQRLARLLKRETDRKSHAAFAVVEPEDLTIMTAGEVAAMLGLELKTVVDLVKRGLIDGLQFEEKEGGYIITIQAVRDFLIREGTRKKRLDQASRLKEKEKHAKFKKAGFAVDE